MKKPVKKVTQLDVLEGRVNALFAHVGPIPELMHKLSTLAARVDGAWGRLTTVGNRVDELSGRNQLPLDWKAELEKLMPLAKALNENPRPAETSERFCVVGDKATCQYPISRTWHSTQERAEQYAASLIRNSSNTEELLVVKVVATVKRKQPEMEVIHY